MAKPDMVKPAQKHRLDLTPAGLDAAAERLQQQTPATRAVRWNLILTVFMRAVALVWIAKGLVSWGTILNVFDPAAPTFEARPVGQQATLIYFAVIDLVAAVGLWLTATWGGVLWLLAVMSHLILGVLFPRLVPSDPLTMGLYLVLVLSYLSTSWLAAADD